MSRIAGIKFNKNNKDIIVSITINLKKLGNELEDFQIGSKFNDTKMSQRLPGLI